jgi:hypothetical protein
MAMHSREAVKLQGASLPFMIAGAHCNALVNAPIENVPARGASSSSTRQGK